MIHVRCLKHNKHSIPIHSEYTLVVASGRGWAVLGWATWVKGVKRTNFQLQNK